MQQRRKRSRLTGLPAPDVMVAVATLDAAKAALEARRLLLGLRSADVGEHTGYSRHAYPEFVSGKSMIRLATFLDFAHALGWQVWLSPRP